MTGEPNMLQRIDSAAQSAVPFIGVVQERARAVCGALRGGDDERGLDGLVSLFDELESLLTFLVVIRESPHALAQDDDLARARGQLMHVCEMTEAALTTQDFVELADALDYDLQPALANAQRRLELWSDSVRSVAA